MRKLGAGQAAGDESFQLSSIELARSPLYILLERGSDLSYRKDLALVDVKAAPWILFGEQTHPVLYAAIAQRASDAGIDPPERHHVTSAEHAAQLAKSTG